MQWVWQNVGIFFRYGPRSSKMDVEFYFKYNGRAFCNLNDSFHGKACFVYLLPIFNFGKQKIERWNSKGRSGYTFWLIFTKNVCRFRTPKVKSGTDMISPSIESSDFLFWHEKICSRIFENFVGNRQSTFHILKFSLSVFDKIFKNPTQNFFMP